MASSSSDSLIGSICKFLIDFVVDVAKDLQKKYNKPVLGILCFVVAAVFCFGTVKSFIAEQRYKARPDRFTVQEEIVSSEDITAKGSTIVEDKADHYWRVTRKYEVDGQEYLSERNEKKPFDKIVHYYYRDENGNAIEFTNSRNAGSVYLAFVGVLVLICGIWDTVEFFGGKRKKERIIEANRERIEGYRKKQRHN